MDKKGNEVSKKERARERRYERSEMEAR